MRNGQNQYNGKYQIMAEINMIPLIDVALVLLIIFMVMTPMLVKNQIQINLPKGKNTDQNKDNKPTILVQIDRTGMVLIDGKNIKADEIEARLKERILDPKNQPLFIEADKDTAFQHVVSVLDAAKGLGIVKMGVNVKKETKSTSN
jgi:biopolymer transport protein ExbD